MAVQVDAGKFKITVDDTKAVPSSDFNNTRFFGHLTQGWDGVKWAGDAITGNGSVPISLAASDSVQVGFVQFARGVSWQAFYAGRTPKEGSIILDFFLPPAMTTTLLLDIASQTAPDPFYRPPANQFVSGAPPMSWGDHPGLSVMRQLDNRAVSTVPNYLFHVFMDREFVTILTVVANGGAPQYIGFFEWQVRYEFKLKWINKDPKVANNASTASVTTKPTAGRPTAAHWQGLLASPSGERANAVGARAELQTNNLGPPNRRDLTTRFANVTPEFWS